MLRLALRRARPNRPLSTSPSPRPHPLRPDKPAPITTTLAHLYDDEVSNDMMSARIPKPAIDILPSEPPSHMRDARYYNPQQQLLYERQLTLEEQTVNIAVNRYRDVSKSATSRGDVSAHHSAAHLLHVWFGPLTVAVRAAQADGTAGGSAGLLGRKAIDQEITHLLAQLSSDAISVIIIHSVLGSLMKEASGVPLARLAMEVANVIRAEINLKKIDALQRRQGKAEREDGEKKRRRSPKNVLTSALRSSSTYVSAVNYAAQQVAVHGNAWSTRETLLVGTRLVDLLMSVAKVEVAGKIVPAIHHYRSFKRAEMVRVGMLQLTDSAMKTLAEESKDLFEFVLPKQQPMLIRPRPWISPWDGAYLRCQSNLVRAPVASKTMQNALAESDLSTLYEGLNALSDQAWRVNDKILNSAEDLWNNGGGIAGLVTKTDYHVPRKKEFMAAAIAQHEISKEERRNSSAESLDGEENTEDNFEFDEKGAARRLRYERRKAQKMNRELVSMRADSNHRLAQGRKFCDEEKIWLPHNVDFRGRAYPMPVHLQHMGCDLTRALLTFANPGVELGNRGVYWLKIHLANLLGGDKLSYEERIELAESAMSRAIEVGNDPNSDANLEWWSTAEDPFQLLAACFEVAAACGRNGGQKAMESFRSSLPISMDGSCNGLQHYAALGRDIAGGTQVNLVPNSRPQDVYSGVAALVREKVDKLAADGDEIGKLLQGKISRKVVKQTVMTSVYGVTLIGARAQIQNRLSELSGFPEEKLFPASMKLASLTLSSLGDIFSGATRTMEWLYDCASRVSRQGHEVQWVTPVGLPVVQPYRRNERMVIKTLMQRVTLERNQDHTPVSWARQRSAFAPNFVHSIDSAHMLLTAIACRKQGMNFAAVHDSFWTNAASVDGMNKILRDEFVKLHQRNLLAELREGFLIRHDDVKIAKVPPRGKLDLSVVRDSLYFFS